LCAMILAPSGLGSGRYLFLYSIIASRVWQ